MQRTSRREKLNNLDEGLPRVTEPSRQKSLPSTSSLREVAAAAAAAHSTSASYLETHIHDGGDSIVHGSLENLYHPVNYRSTSKSRKSRSKGSRSRKELLASMSVGELFQGKVVNGDKVTTPMDETQMLYIALDEERRKILIRRAACSFLYGALRRQSEKISMLGSRVKVKTQEAAARLILHHLLLNSFRKRGRELELLMKENIELHKTVENLTLQLRVVRHIQVTEKQKSLEKDHGIKTLVEKIEQLKGLLEASQAQLANVEEESRKAHADKSFYETEIRRIREEMRVVEDQHEFLSANLELEKNRASKFLSESSSQKRKIIEMKQMIDELTTQSTQWQEKARTFESQNWELTNRLREREDEINSLQDDCKNLNQALFADKEKRVSLKKENESLESRLRTSTKELTRLKKSLLASKKEIDAKDEQIIELEEKATRTKNENLLIRAELMQFRLQNLQKRRMWTNFFVTLITPFESFRCFLLQPRGVPKAVDLSEVELDPRNC